jgi:hypothetical protein
VERNKCYTTCFTISRCCNHCKPKIPCVLARAFRIHAAVTLSRELHRLCINWCNPPPPYILWKIKVNFRFHNLLAPILSQRILPIQPHPNPLRPILIIFSHLSFGLPSTLFPSRFAISILHTFLLSPICGTCLATLILFHLVILVILGEGYKLWSSSSYRFLKPLVPSSIHVPYGLQQ